jgi:calcineurin-like phosphoesterase family protein
MKIRLCSDLHLEFDLELAHQTRLVDRNAPRPRYIVWDPGNTPADVLVLSGDILTFDMLDSYNGYFIDWLADRCADYELVIWIPGNHEYYSGRFIRCQARFAEWNARINEIVKTKGYKGTLLLGDRHTVVKNDVKFICTTLWTDFMRDNPLVILYMQNNLKDYKRIKYDQHLLIPPQILAEHKLSRAFIEKEIQYDGKVVVISHHAPSYQSIHPNFRGDNLNYGYFSDLDHLVERITLWCHGHTHSSFDYHIGDNPAKGRVVCNPRGYLNYAMNKEFNPALVVDI